MTIANSLHVRSTEEALASAADLRTRFALEASHRDADRELPRSQLRELASSGLLAMTVPLEYGGPDLPFETVAEVFRLLAAADPSIAQIPHSHFTFLEALRLQGDSEQKTFFYSEVLAGKLFANAQSERGPHPITVDTTILAPRDGGFMLTGRKFYSTGALFADWIIVRASMSDGSVDFRPEASTAKAVAFVPRSATGLTVIDDWDGMGQRTTASGTVTLDAVNVPNAHVVPFTAIFDRASTYGAQAQILHTAIDVGIATAALAEAVKQTASARPHFEANVDHAGEDPLLIQLAGEATVTVWAAQALLAAAGRAIDAARSALTEDSAAHASIAVAIAKVAAARAALEASTVLFELGGTRSASNSGNLSRFWRDARTHTLHDPTRWKVQHIGRWTLAGTPPPRHGQI